jgi:glycosyltransferase involved in cell wall biosynthesis
MEKPDLTIVIPAYNEEEFLAKTLDAVHQALERLSVRAEVIVVDNNSTDRTAELARQAGATVVFEPVNHIARARNAGGRAAAGTCLVFIDADTLVSSELVDVSLRLLQSGNCCGGGAKVEFDVPLDFMGRALTATWNWVAPRKGWAAGSYLFCLKKAFDDTGGFSESVYASEEVWFSNRLVRWGKKRGLAFRVIREHSVLTSGRKFRWSSPARVYTTMFLLAGFPFLLRWKCACSLWYKRPTQIDCPHAP